VSRNFTATGPNRLWLADITEHATGEGKLYLCAIKEALRGPADVERSEGGTLRRGGRAAQRSVNPEGTKPVHTAVWRIPYCLGADPAP
jgi:hypothetical protein